MFRGLRPDTVVAEPAAGARAAAEPFTLTWAFGAGRAWEYPSTLQVMAKESGWVVHWQPSTTGRGEPATS